MNRNTTYYVEVYRFNNRPRLKFSKGRLDREHLSEATIGVYMVRDCSTQEEAIASLLAEFSSDSPNVTQVI